MKSKIIREFKELGFRRFNGKKLENYSFYTLVGFYTRIKKGEVIK